MAFQFNPCTDCPCEPVCEPCTPGEGTCTSCSIQVVLAGFANDPADCVDGCDVFNDTFITTRPPDIFLGSGCGWSYVLTGTPDCPTAAQKATWLQVTVFDNGFVTVELRWVGGPLVLWQLDYGEGVDIPCETWVDEDIPFLLSSLGCDDFSGNMTCELTTL